MYSLKICTPGHHSDCTLTWRTLNEAVIIMNLELIQESTSLTIILVVVFVPASETLTEFIM